MEGLSYSDLNVQLRMHMNFFSYDMRVEICLILINSLSIIVTARGRRYSYITFGVKNWNTNITFNPQIQPIYSPLGVMDYFFQLALAEQPFNWIWFPCVVDGIIVYRTAFLQITKSSDNAGRVWKRPKRTKRWLFSHSRHESCEPANLDRGVVYLYIYSESSLVREHTLYRSQLHAQMAWSASRRSSVIPFRRFSSRRRRYPEVIRDLCK